MAASRTPVPIFNHLFIHVSSWRFFHVAGNMLYLWIFGNNIENSMGHFRFIVFYLISGIVAVYIFAFMNPGSTIPMVGASGAVSGVLGAYLVLFPRAKVLTWYHLALYTEVIKVPAVFVLGFWIVLQILNGMVSREAAAVLHGLHILADSWRELFLLDYLRREGCSRILTKGGYK